MNMFMHYLNGPDVEALETGEDVLGVRSGDQYVGVVTLAAIRARTVSEQNESITAEPSRSP